VLRIGQLGPISALHQEMDAKREERFTCQLLDNGLAHRLRRSRHDANEAILVTPISKMPRAGSVKLVTSFPSARYGLKSTVVSMVSVEIGSTCIMPVASRPGEAKP
jgi:hypothetical protein